MRAAFLCLAVLTLAGCNQYELFRLSGFQQDSFSNKADLLFIVDNSESMQPIAEDLAINFAGFIESVAAVEDTIERNDLSDAVENYQNAIGNPSAYVDFQIGMTTTDVEEDRGALLGRPKPNVMPRDQVDLSMDFIETLMCDATCWNPDNIPTGGGGDCSQPPSGEVRQGYLDCLCGAGNWENANCGSADEEPFEAAFLAMCRAVPNPPLDCFEEFAIGTDTYPPLLSQSDVESNAGLRRERSTLLPIIVSDEGDDSRRLSQGDSVAEIYIDLMRKFGGYTSWVVIGPPTTPDEPKVCPGTSSEFGLVRYQYVTLVSNGLQIDILDPSSCNPVDFRTALDELGKLLSSLLTEFPLQSVPKPDTLLVFVNGEQIPAAESLGTDRWGLETLGNGWTYNIQTNAIQFHGTAIPPNDAEVDVYYEPIDGMPRTLPF